jgi:hypothetical protein
MRLPSGFGLWLCCSLGLSGCFAIANFDDVNIEPVQRQTFQLPFNEVVELDGFDILFVVDNSPDLSPIAAAVGARSGAFDLEATLAENDALGGAPAYAAPPTLHIGVITSNLGAEGQPIPGCEGGGDDGLLRTEMAPGCPTLDGTFLMIENGLPTNLVDEGGEPVTSLTMSEAITCLVQGQAERPGCYFSQPARAATQAQQQEANTGFFRSGAGLAVIVVSDKDDCSVRSADLFDPSYEREAELGPFGTFRCFEFGVTCDVNDRNVAGVRASCAGRTDAAALLHPVPELFSLILGGRSASRVVMTRISGPPGPVEVAIEEARPSLAPSCTGDSSGYPAVRLDELRRAFGLNGLETSVCQPDMDQLMSQVSERLAAIAMYRCLPLVPADADREPGNGRQIDCRVVDVTDPDTLVEQRSEPLPACAEGADNRPCWQVNEEESCTSGFKMEVLRWLEPAPSTVVEADCLVELP